MSDTENGKDSAPQPEDETDGMDENVQVGWAIKYRDENTDPESETFGSILEWWEFVADIHQTPPEGAVPMFVRGDDAKKPGRPYD